MNKNIRERLEELKAELRKGQTMLADIEEQKVATTASLLRISGAIQVLGEILESEPCGATVQQGEAASNGSASSVYA